MKNTESEISKQNVKDMASEGLPSSSCSTPLVLMEPENNQIRFSWLEEDKKKREFALSSSHLTLLLQAAENNNCDPSLVDLAPRIKIQEQNQDPQ